MGNVRLGTAGWTDKTLIDSGWYPSDAKTHEQRLRYYASQFPLVEVDLPYVCVDEPQGYPSSIPPVLAVTSDLALVRMHGHSDKWDSKSIQEKFGYRYSDKELAEWAGNVERLAADAAETHVVFNNCYRDYAQVNARQLAEALDI